MKTKIFLSACLIVIASSLSAQNYIGAKKCKMCHNKPTKGAQYTKWAEASHSKAYEVLSETEKQDPKCLKCHSTAASVDQSLVLTITVEEGVSCESCHGPGSGYKKKTVMEVREDAVKAGLVIPTEELCKKCHNDESPHFEGFNYEEALKKIAHPAPVAE